MKWLTGLIVFALCLPACAAACDLQSLTVTGSHVRAGSISVDLGEADDPLHPTAWQGPLLIGLAGKPACTVSDVVAPVEAPLLSGNGRLLFVPTYSGSTNRVYVVDVRDCQVVWKSPAFSGRVSYAKNTLVIGRRKLRLSPSCRF